MRAPRSDAPPAPPGDAHAQANLTDRFVLLRTALFAAALLILLLLPWPGLGEAFVGVIAAILNPLLAALVSVPGQVELGPATDEHAWNAVLTIKREGRIVQHALWELRRTPYLPMAAFAALALAYPASKLSGRLRVLFIGWSVLVLLPLLRLLTLFGEPGPMQLVAMPSALHAALTIAARALLLPPGMAYAVPALLWLTLVAWLDRRALR